MARQRKILVNSTGDLTNERKNRRELEESLVKNKLDKLEAPSWLEDEFAISEFYRLGKELQDIEAVTNLDLNTLASYCQAFSKYVEATISLNKETLTIKKTMPNGSINVVENPLINIQKKYAEECRRFANLCGLTIDSRLKIGAMKAEKLNNEVGNDFGEI